MPATVNASVKISPTLKNRFLQLAELRKTSTHSLMLQALENFVAHEEKREEWRQEGIRAWQEFQLTGLHLTNNEILEWMDKVIAGDSESLPKCHV